LHSLLIYISYQHFDNNTSSPYLDLLFQISRDELTGRLIIYS
jgi:hypothetical protein